MMQTHSLANVCRSVVVVVVVVSGDSQKTLWKEADPLKHIEAFSTLTFIWVGWEGFCWGGATV